VTKPNHGELELVYTAGSTSEAMVIRGLLQGAGIPSPSLGWSDPFPMAEPPEGFQTSEIYVHAAQAEEARRIIDQHRAANRGPQAVEPEE
jgi:hypothetical protein